MAARISRRGGKYAATNKVRKETGKRSGLEVSISNHLASEGVAALYEPGPILFHEPGRDRKYFPDWELPNGILIEGKGWFKSEDRKKHLLIKYQHPELDIRFVFSNPQTKIGKKSTTTYAKWCETAGFLYAKGLVPEAWWKEPSRTAIAIAGDILDRQPIPTKGRLLR